MQRIVSQMRELQKQRMLRRSLCAIVLLVALAPNLAAHNGPPFPIITDQRIGPYTVSLWTHPDLGIGTFFVLVNAPPGKTVPKDLKIQIGVQPATGRLPEAVYSAWVEDLRGQVEYKAEAQFDQQENWKVRLTLASSIGGGQVFSQVVPTPAGFGRWDLLLYLLPFLGVGFLWFTAIAKRRKLRKAQVQRSA